MGLRIELRTRYCRQNAQNFGPELLGQVPGPFFFNKVCPNPAGTIANADGRKNSDVR